MPNRLFLNFQIIRVIDVHFGGQWTILGEVWSGLAWKGRLLAESIPGGVYSLALLRL